MKVIDKNSTSTLIINKSKFITKLIKIQNINDIPIELARIKEEYKDATHYCYAYIINNIKHFKDDGEPNGTAGMPILNVLENNNLTNILCIVIRYFGGIKLGVGGLVRAYTKSVTNSLDDIIVHELIEGYKIHIIFSYDNSKKIDYLLNNENIIFKDFNQNIEYIFIININQYQNIEQKLKKLCLEVNLIENLVI